jgi:hypothetical protein
MVTPIPGSRIATIRDTGETDRPASLFRSFLTEMIEHFQGLVTMALCADATGLT